MLNEVNHRVKNSLQIVSSILHLQLPHAKSPEAADALRSAGARVMAIAAVHERLYTGSDVRVVSLDEFLESLCEEIGRALGCSEDIKADFAPVQVPTDMAVPLALIVNELVTNAIKYASPPWRVMMRTGPQHPDARCVRCRTGPFTRHAADGNGNAHCPGIRPAGWGSR